MIWGCRGVHSCRSGGEQGVAGLWWTPGAATTPWNQQMFGWPAAAERWCLVGAGGPASADEGGSTPRCLMYQMLTSRAAVAACCLLHNHECAAWSLVVSHV
jgi:hypothetical protein